MKDGIPVDVLMRMPWTLDGPFLRDDEHGNTWWEIRVKELPDFFVADKWREKVMADFTDAFRCFLESFTSHGELPPLPSETIWNWLAMMVSPNSATGGGWCVVSSLSLGESEGRT